MTVLLWIVLTPLALCVAAVALVFLVAIVRGLTRDVRTDPGAAETAARVAAHGLLPAERQHTERAAPLAPALAVALAAARAGDWAPAAELLDATAEARDWEGRTALCERLADLAAEEDGWLRDWEEARPADPGAALVRARGTVFLAWNVRGGQRDEDTTQEQAEGFRRVLARSRAEHTRAVALAPAEDPAPYVGAIWTAMGLGLPHEELRRLWHEVTDRAPHHYEAHFAALQYWCGKWCGSAEQAHAFAVRAAAGAPAGSLLTALPLIAHFEHDTSDATDVDRTPEMYAAVDALLADVTAADPDHPRLPEARHLLAYYLWLQDRHTEAMEQFRLVDGYVGALPWRYKTDPAEEFCRARDDCAGHVPDGESRPPLRR
ncbi:hypothetical protein GCM10010222_06040 [Streptomyces tanashiensis]|uniref:hypothetical protein n=1 Tax=Streptomyces tanashiensis TaxID=67367 RepID=UPI001678DF51|nr:hypothetical protein [Streptomyces tanashiensis]GGS68150.1 hypothetical protein GCM10010222_06040 [Streptomyces tanashiensis]